VIFGARGTPKTSFGNGVGPILWDPSLSVQVCGIRNGGHGQADVGLGTLAHELGPGGRGDGGMPQGMR